MIEILIPCAGRHGGVLYSVMCLAVIMSTPHLFPVKCFSERKTFVDEGIIFYRHQMRQTRQQEQIM